MLLNPSSLQAAFLAYDTKFRSAYEKTPVQWDKIATLISSTTAEQIHAWVDRVPQLRKWVGERQINNIKARAQSLVNEKYEDTIGIDREKFEDDQYGIYSPAIEMLGEAARVWPDQLVVAALQAGDSSLCYDGQFFFDTDHPIDPSNPSAGTQSNSFNLALNAANYQTVRAAMMSYKGADGAPLGVNPNLLVVPPALEGTARTILNADFIAAPSNTATQSNVLKGTADVLVMPRLAGQDTTWYLMDTSRVIKPLIFQQRQAPEFAFLNRPDDHAVVSTDTYLFGVRARGAGGYGLYWLAAKSSP
jgi:phage major head subunit gpT-like protein